MEKMAGTTRLELATSAVTGQRSNQLNYVPSFDGNYKIQASPVGHTTFLDNFISLSDESPVVISAFAASGLHLSPLLSFDPVSTSFFVSSTRPMICVHSETMLPATCPHFDSESECA